MSTRLPGEVTDLQPGGVPARPPPADQQPVRVQLVVSGGDPPDFGGGLLRLHRSLLRMHDHYKPHVDVLAFAGAADLAELSEADAISVRRVFQSHGALMLFRVVGKDLRRLRDSSIEIIQVIATGWTNRCVGYKASTKRTHALKVA